jgi:hypothetical protein
MITSTNHLVFKEHSTWIWHCLDQWEQQLSVTTTVLWGTWASLQSQEKHKPLWSGSWQKEAQVSLLHRLCFSSVLGLVPVFNQLSSSETSERQRDQESLESKILQRDCRGKRPESLESRAQRTLIFIFIFFFVVGHDFSFFFLLFS